MTDQFTVIATAIIRHQEEIVGSLAWTQAGKVSGLVVKNQTVSFKGDVKIALSDLVKQYESLFGRASVEVCRDAVRKLLVDVDKKSVPDILL